MLANIKTSFKRLSQSSQSKNGAGYANGTQSSPCTPNSSTQSKDKQPQDTLDTRTRYVVPGIATVQVVGEFLPRTISSLKGGEKILGIRVTEDAALIWTTVHSVAPRPVSLKAPGTIVASLGGDDALGLLSEHVVLARDRKKKIMPQQARRLEIGVDSLILYHIDGLRNTGKSAQEIKKITSIRVARNPQQAMHLYDIEVDGSQQSVFVSDSLESKYFFVLTAPGASVEQKAFEGSKAAIVSGSSQVRIQNTFINVESEPAQEVGIPRSYSDSDIRRLAIEMELEEERLAPAPLFSNDDVLSLSSGTSSKLTKTSKASSYTGKSEVSSASSKSATQVRIGTQQNVDENGNQMCNPSDEILLTDYSSLPVNEFGIRLSAASVTHQPGRKSRCRKCAFYNTFSLKHGKTCKNGALCDFCHEPHGRFIHRRS